MSVEVVRYMVLVEQVVVEVMVLVVVETVEMEIVD